MAIDLFKEFATNVAAEEQGAWEEYAEGVEFLIARANNKTYARLLNRAVEKNKRLLDAKNDAAEAKSQEIIIDVMAKSILLGWRGSFEWAGKPVGEYSVDMAKTMLAVKDFRRWVAEKSEDIDRFKDKEQEEDKGK
jgi:hypothetical protein